MDMTTKKEDLKGISKEDAEKLIDRGYLRYYAWDQDFGSTAGPFKGIGGQSFATFTIEAWSDGRKAVIFCKGRVVKIVDKFEPMNVRF